MDISSGKGTSVNFPGSATPNTLPDPEALQKKSAKQKGPRKVDARIIPELPPCLAFLLYFPFLVLPRAFQACFFTKLGKHPDLSDTCLLLVVAVGGIPDRIRRPSAPL